MDQSAHVHTHTETHISTVVSNLPGFEHHLEQGSPTPRPQSGCQVVQQERQVSEWSVTCIYSLPLLALPPELCSHIRVALDSILVGVQTLLWTVHVRDLGSLWETNTWWSGGEVRRWCQCCGTAANTGYHSQRLECTETIISQLPADSWKPWQLTI